MKQTKLIQYLSTLNTQELKSFQKFLRSPYHNSNKQLIPLLRALARYHPLFDSSKLDKAIIFRRIHPEGTIYEEDRMNQLMTQMVKQLEQFFAVEQIKHDNFQLSKHRLLAFQQRELQNSFSKEAKKMERLLNSWRQDEQYHLERFLLNKTIFFHPQTPRYRLGMTSLGNCLEQLDLFFLHEKLRFTAISFNRMRIMNETHEIKLLQAHLNTFKSIIAESPVLSFYEKVIKVQQTEDEVLLINLSEDLEQLLMQLEKGEQHDFFLLIYNLCSQNYRMGKSHFLSILFDLNNLRLKLNLLQIDKGINHIAFINIASIGSANKEFEWTKTFIQKNKEFLHSESREDSVKLALAYLSFHKAITKNEASEYRHTIDFLQNLDYTKPYFSYRSKSLSLRTYFEYYLQKEENLNFVLDYTNAFERHISRHKTMEKTKALTFLNFIKQTRKVIKLRFNKNRTPKEVDRIRQVIKNNDNLFGKNWLLEKIGELR